MKSQKTKITTPKYSDDYKNVFNRYLLKNEIIKNHNKLESDILKDKKA